MRHLPIVSMSFGWMCFITSQPREHTSRKIGGNISRFIISSSSGMQVLMRIVWERLCIIADPPRKYALSIIVSWARRWNQSSFLLRARCYVVHGIFFPDIFTMAQSGNGENFQDGIACLVRFFWIARRLIEIASFHRHPFQQRMCIDPPHYRR